MWDWLRSGQGQKVTNESSRELMFCAVNLQLLRVVIKQGMRNEEMRNKEMRK